VDRSTRYFCERHQPGVKFAFTSYGVSIGPQAVGAHPDRVAALQRFSATYHSNDEYGSNAITHVMACAVLVPGRLIRREGR
jgi:hypothetical protein